MGHIIISLVHIGSNTNKSIYIYIGSEGWGERDRERWREIEREIEVDVDVGLYTCIFMISKSIIDILKLCACSRLKYMHC